MTTPAIPQYPASPPDLIRLLLQREKARLLGPLVMQAVANDESGEIRRDAAAAMEELCKAHAWVDRCASSEGY